MSETRNELERFYREKGARLWRALVGYTGDPDVASDALAEAFAQAFAAPDRLRSPASWVWRAAFRIAAGELKARKERPDLIPDRSYEIPEPIDHVLSALGRLSPNQRLAVILHDYADRPVEEVARALGASRATVYVHLSQGRKRLRRLLEGSDA